MNIHQEHKVMQIPKEIICKRNVLRKVDLFTLVSL